MEKGRGGRWVFFWFYCTVFLKKDFLIRKNWAFDCAGTVVNDGGWCMGRAIARERQYGSRAACGNKAGVDESVKSVGDVVKDGKR